MKKRILALGVVLALVAVMALPMAVFAAEAGLLLSQATWTDLTLVAPAPFALGTTPGTLALGANAGSSAAGVGNNQCDGLDARVSDIKTDTTGYMTKGGLDVAGTGLLVDAIQVGATAPVAGIGCRYYRNLSDCAPGPQLNTAKCCGPGTYSIPLYANQTVVVADAAGTYSITLTYVATPGT